MLKKIIVLSSFIILFTGLIPTNAQYMPQGKKFGFGIILGDPTGGTAKIWVKREKALAFYLGASFF